MIAGHYQLELHCEDDSHRIERSFGTWLDLNHFDGCGGMATRGGPIGIGRFTAASAEGALRVARLAGWHLDPGTYKAWCPAHSYLCPSGKKQNQGESP